MTFISGGVQASIEVPGPGFGSMVLSSQRAIYYFLLVFVVLAIVATLNLMRSRVGRAFIAIRDQDIAAEIIGINIFRYKLLAFAVSAFYAGVTGVLYTYFLGIANYEQFQIGASIDYLAMIIIGGLGSVLGSVFGAIFVTLLPIGIRYAMEAFGGPVLLRGHRAQPHSRPPPHRVRRPHHRLPHRGARGAEPAVAEHPQLFPSLAVRVLRYARKETAHASDPGYRDRAAGRRVRPGGRGLGAAQAKSEIVIGVQCDRTGPTQIVGTTCAPACTTTSRW